MDISEGLDIPLDFVNRYFEAHREARADAERESQACVEDAEHADVVVVADTDYQAGLFQAVPVADGCGSARLRPNPVQHSTLHWT